jgi:N-acyl homoserine lactone hydrolase
MRLYVMRLGLRPSTGAPYPGYLIRADDGTNLLVDSGFPADAYRGGEAASPPWPRLDPADWVVNRLAEIGVAPGEIRYLVCTHLDPDHAGSHDAFLGAEWVVQRANLDAARAGVPARTGLVRPHWDRPDARWRIVEGDTELLPGIELIESGGHVPGHQSLLVRLPETGPVLLAIDAIPRRLGAVAPEAREAGPFDLDEAAVRTSTRKLVDLASREGAFVIHGHDPEQWSRIRKSPAFYG